MKPPLFSISSHIGSADVGIDITNRDKAVPPELQRSLSKRMGARTIVVESSHMAMISHAKEVLNVIREAAAHCSA